MNVPASAQPQINEKSENLSVALAGFTEKTGVAEQIALLSDWLQRAGVLVRTVSVADAFEMRDIPVILFYDSAQDAVSKALVQEISPMTALADWRATTETCLAGYRRNRRGLTLLDAGAFEDAPNSYLKVLSARFGWAGKNLDLGGGSQDLPQDVDQRAILRVIAAVAVSNDPLARRLDGELQAGALWPETKQGEYAKTGADPETAFAVYLKSQTGLSARVEEEFAAAQQDRTALEQQLMDTQAALENQLLVLTEQKNAAQQGKTALEQQLMDTQAELENQFLAQFSQQDQAQREKDLLMQQLSNTQAELETYFLELQEARKQNDTYAVDLKAFHDKAQRHRKDADLLRLDIKELQSKETETKALLEEALQRIDVLQGEIAQRDDEINALRNSTSWRITSPIRGVGDTIKGTRGRG